MDPPLVVRDNAIFERAKLNIHSQDEGESVESFITSLYCLAEYCQYDILKEEMIQDRIVIGISNISVSLKLQMGCALTVKKAFDMTRKNQAVKKEQSFLRSNLAIVAILMSCKDRVQKSLTSALKGI